MPSPVLGGRAKALTTAEWGEVIHKPSYSIQRARAGIEEDETIALGVHWACPYLPFLIIFIISFFQRWVTDVLHWVVSFRLY